MDYWEAAFLLSRASLPASALYFWLGSSSYSGLGVTAIPASLLCLTLCVLWPCLEAARAVPAQARLLGSLLLATRIPRPNFLSSSTSSFCTVCQSDLGPLSLRAETRRCGHSFHLWCLWALFRAAERAASVLAMRCPNCNTGLP